MRCRRVTTKEAGYVGLFYDKIDSWIGLEVTAGTRVDSERQVCTQVLTGAQRH